MKNVPCFLTLLVFSLLLWTGCAASSTPSITKASSASSLKLEAEKGVGSDYKTLVENSLIARFLRGVLPEPEPKRKLRPGQTVYICQATGHFNLAPPPDDHLLMKKFCVNPLALAEGYLDGFRVEDEVAPRLEGEGNFYRIPFMESVIEVKVNGGKKNLILHYQDEGGQCHQFPLSARQGEYMYSIVSLVPDSVVPDTQEWVLDAEEIERYRRGGQK